MHSFTTRLVVTTVGLAASVVAAGCDGAVRLRGRVVDTAGAPISTARIHLQPTRNGRQFDDAPTADGCFTIGHVVAPGRYNYKVLITAPGYKSAEGVIVTNENNRSVVVLRRETESAPSSIATDVATGSKNDIVGCEPSDCCK